MPPEEFHSLPQGGHAIFSLNIDLTHCGRKIPWGRGVFNGGEVGVVTI